MSIFSQSVSSTIIDPSFTSETRAEIRLNNNANAYLPTLKLGNIGLEKDPANENKYSFGSGCASVISRISLMDGSEPLDTLRNVGQWITFTNTLKTNSQNSNIFDKTMGGSVGWQSGSTGELLSNQDKRVGVGTADSLGLLDLREVFPLLQNISHLSTKLFKNLRVVIEYNTDPKLLVNFQKPADVLDGLKKTIPFLIADEIIDASLVASLDKQLTSVNFTAIEHDQVAVPQVPGITSAGANTDSAVQSVMLRVNGFQNKACGRLLISKVFQDADNYIYNVEGNNATQSIAGYGANGSRAQHKEKINLRVNGRNLLAGEGVTTPESMAMLLADTFGDQNVCMGQVTESVGLDTKYNLFVTERKGTAILPSPGFPPQNWVGVNETAPRILENGGDPSTDGTTWDTAPTAESGVWTGNSSWFGCSIMDRVTDLQVALTRTGTVSSPRTPEVETTDTPRASVGNYLPLDLNCFMEVSKQLQVSNGSYKVVYV